MVLRFVWLYGCHHLVKLSTPFQARRSLEASHMHWSPKSSLSAKQEQTKLAARLVQSWLWQLCFFSNLSCTAYNVSLTGSTCRHLLHSNHSVQMHERHPFCLLATCYMPHLPPTTCYMWHSTYLLLHDTYLLLHATCIHASTSTNEICSWIHIHPIN